MTRNPFIKRHTTSADPKLALLRRADTERDSKGFSLTGERKRGALIKDAPITLPRLKFLERADDVEGWNARAHEDHDDG